VGAVVVTVIGAAVLANGVPSIEAVPSMISAWTHAALLRIIGFGLLAGVIATAGAVIHRWGTMRPIPIGVAILAGCVFPALAVLAEGLRRGVLLEPAPLAGYASGLYVLGVCSSSALAGAGGRSVGDHLACRVFEIRRVDPRTPGGSALSAAGLTIACRPPPTIDRVEGYRQLPVEHRQRLTNRSLLLPRALDPDTRAQRVRSRLQRDFDLDALELSMRADGTIEHLAVGRRRRGLSPLVPPGTEAVTVRTSPPATIEPGDPVEVWTAEGTESPTLVTTGTLHVADGEIATVFVDSEGESSALDADRTYRLSTPSTPPDDGHAFARQLRSTRLVVNRHIVEPDSPIDGEFVEWVAGTVAALKRGDDGEWIPYPPGNETLRPGDEVYILEPPASVAEPSRHEGVATSDGTDRAGHSTDNVGGGR